MKKILYATDFSKNAENAFHFALEIAKKHQAELILLHVFDNPPGWDYSYMTDPIEAPMKAALKWKGKLKEFFEQFDSKLEPLYLAIENTSAVQGILSAIDIQNPELIITGTKGKSKLEEIFLGSTIKALVEKSPVPVLAIPENAVYRDFKKVTYASDFKEIDFVAIEQLIEFLEPYKPEIKIIHISTDDESRDIEKMEWFKELVNENFSYKNISCELMLADKIFDRLNNYLNQYGCDLLGMLKKERHGFVEKLINEDLVSKMEFETTVPLLSYNELFLRVKESYDIEENDSIES